ncbi:MAG: CoA pyrophosphatase [Deltaproteobacteria bacterium]|nr:CoA pyrophosphatase [Deltaproteobacteria bacterium]
MTVSDELINAAVLIPLLVPDAAIGGEAFRLRTRTGELVLPAATEVVLTVRTHTVEHHKGQISFPGGAHEPDDATLEATALRESLEEIGLLPESVEVVAELPETPTFATPFRVFPFVGIVRKPMEFKPNPDEIGEIIRVPLSFLMDPAHSTLETYERNGLRVQMRAYHFDSHRIWGATGRMLQILLEKFVSKA